MNLFGLEGSGFIISLALTLLISGAIMFYCLKRFAILESSIIDQGKILQAFIIRMQEMNNNSLSLANNTAISSAVKQHSVMNDNISNNADLIKVSDNDSSSESDDDSSDDSGDESNHESVNEIVDINSLNGGSNIEIDIKLDTELHEPSNDIKIISIEELQPEVLSTNILNIKSSSSESNSDTESSVDIESNYIEEFDSSSQQKEILKGGITKMKVADLRDMVFQQGLVTSQVDANKKKKDELIKLLQEK